MKLYTYDENYECWNDNPLYDNVDYIELTEGYVVVNFQRGYHVAYHPCKDFGTFKIVDDD